MGTSQGGPLSGAWRAYLVHSDASLALSSFPWHMGIRGPLEYKLLMGGNPVPSLEYEGWIGWQLTSGTLQASSSFLGKGLMALADKEKREMEGDRKT